MPVYIRKDGKSVSISRNLRQMIRYAGKHKVEEVTVERLHPDPYQPMAPQAKLTVKFCDGATCETEFASYAVAKSFVTARIQRWNGLFKPLFRTISNEPEALKQRGENLYYLYSWE